MAGKRSPHDDEADEPVVGEGDGVMLSKKEQILALVDEHFPEDATHHQHNRPLADRVREFGKALAELF